MNFLELMQHISINKGATIRVNEVDNYSVINFESGYQVATNDEYIYNMKKQLDKIFKLFKGIENGVIGLWLDDGDLFIDLSVKYLREKDSAIRLAKEFNQLAIFDWSTMEEIKIN
jgi:hypothetical protein